MTISGKIRIYELSRDLGLENKDVLNAANMLSIAVKSHSSSISDEEASRITQLIKSKARPTPDRPAAKAILSVKKAAPPAPGEADGPAAARSVPARPSAPGKPTPRRSATAPVKPAVGSRSKPAPTKPAAAKPSRNKPPAAARPVAPVKPAAAKPGTTAAKSGPSSVVRPVSKPAATAPSQSAAPAKPAVPSKPAASTKSAAPAKPAVPSKPAAPAKSAAPAKPVVPSKPAASTKSAVPAKPAAASTAPATRPAARPDIVRPAVGRPSAPVPRPVPAKPTAGRPELISRPAARPSKPELVDRPPVMPAAPVSRTASGSPPGVTRRAPGSGAAPGTRRTPRPELVGKPIRSNGTPARPATPGQVADRPDAVRPPGVTRRPMELVGKPVRRNDSGDTARPQRPATPPGIVRTGSPAGRREGLPPGVRRPVAPSELLGLNKPGPATPPNRPTAPVPRPTAPSVDRQDALDDQQENASRRPATPPTGRFGPGRGRAAAGAPRRPGRPDWDDSARLDQLRRGGGGPQRQRTKVHIIGENDDDVAAREGFAGEGDAAVLAASLARPSKPRSAVAAARIVPVAQRKRRKETARQRQRRRAMELRQAREAAQVRPEMIVVPEDGLTVQELAERISVESSEVIKSLFFKGVIATVTQTLDVPTIEALCEQFGVPVLEDDVEEAARKTVEMIEEADRAHLIRRPPVVTVMGHVDHGKTSLLDAIRNTRVTAGEAGGITQHIGAYQVDVGQQQDQRQVTFLDTPGHEAFTAMRARGTKVTDIAVLVVAADDGVRPQTLEAISHARAAEVPIIVAINKIDKEGAQPDRVKQELSDQDLLPEDWGGSTVMVPVSAINGQNIDRLLEMILLVSDVEDLQANPDRMARGTVVEAHLDKAKGPVATLLVQNGTLRTGDVIAAGPVLGRVRAMMDDSGKRVKQSGPSCPVEALGFSEVPTAGDEFEVYADEKSARAVVGHRVTDARATRLAQQMASRRVSLASISGEVSDGDLKELNIILKADVQGSLEAILGSLEQLPKDEVQIRVLLSAPGEVTETDIDLAAASGAVVIGFNTSMASGAKRAAEAASVDVRDYDVIYKLLEDIQLAMEGLLEPELVEQPLGRAEVRAIFAVGKGSVAGCYVQEGKLQRNCRVRVHRGRQTVYEGDLDSLRRLKDDVREVNTGFECGISVDRFSGWEEGDSIEAFRMVTKKRTLTV